MKRIRTAAAVAAGILCVSALALAGEEAGQGGYDEAAMMEAWMKAATPGAQHEMLAGMAGTWNTKLTHYEMGKVSEESEGTCEFEPIMGGRVVVGHYKGEMMGQPHEGMSLDGFDNVTGKFWSTWIDNMGTSLSVSHGEMNEDGALVHKGTMTSPMGEMGMRFVTTREGDDKMNMDMYMSMPGSDEETLSMTIEYTRASS